ncbi:ribokinase [Methylobacterium sp. J-068]|uniref:ribokinase n=1 Tax=Methylobacterium sp. J-068 TaxID=2836649 RepID=UPI001FBA3707|nr:ribokinase [Methylobacterium sp. J-068]MCJ2033848.1 ribokinase [Methylobacterium sp. J-068]
MNETEPARIFVVGSFVVACCVMVARLPRPGESLSAADLSVEPGGKGFNLAVTSHRLGSAVDGVFAVGDDAFSELAATSFRLAGLSTAMIRSYAGTTGAGVGFIDGTGENCLAVHMGANDLLSAAEIDRCAPAIARANLTLATFESPDGPILAGFSIARRAGKRTLLNPSPYRPVDPGLLAQTSIVVVNEVEAGQWADASGTPVSPGAPARAYADLADAILRGGPDLVVVTLGARGAVVFRPGQAPCHQPAIPGETVDTIGAGDAFTGGLAASLIRDLPLEESLLRATACGAIATRRFGAFHAFPTTQDLDDFLDALPGDQGAGRTSSALVA